MDVNEVLKYFPDLTEKKISQIEKLGPLYAEWNSKINVVSRKDIDNLYERHVLHSLAIAKFLGEVDDATTFLDMGTGGGFPGIPLAIFYPQCKFHLVDRIGKKIKVAQEIATAIGLNNVTFQHGDIGECRLQYNYVVSRAVMPLNGLVPLIRKNIIKSRQDNGNRWGNGLICLKGGDLQQEKEGINHPIVEMPVCDFFPEEFFKEKFIVYVAL